MSTQNEHQTFVSAGVAQVRAQGSDPLVAEATQAWMVATEPHRYSYHFSWLGLPIIQYPPDIVAIQELLWAIKPDLVIETGVARGGSLMLSASILALMEVTEATESGELIDPREPKRRVLGIDIDIRPHNRAAIERHPLSPRISLIQGSSVDPDIVASVHRFASEYDRVMVLLDSNHTHQHVRQELEAYAGLTSIGSYCVVFDTIIERMPPDTYPDRPWGPGDNPATAVHEFLAVHPEFAVDEDIDRRLLISVAPGGYLKREK